MRTYWLSFADDGRPEGQQFLGVCVVDVTEADAADALALIDQLFPQHADPGGWMAAALRKAHTAGCNPGGQVMAVLFPDPPPATVPRGQLLQLPELERLGLA